MGFLNQIATLVDNTGKYVELVHEKTVEDVVQAWPRLGWSGCFAHAVRREVKLKPWSHTTKIEGFAEMIEGNEYMAKFE